MAGQSYDHLAGNPMDVKNHPDTVLPDVGPLNKPASADDFSNYLKTRKNLDSLSSQMNFYNALGNLYKQGQ